jgi:NAD(P)-dependent dehydrogenase (short-subunit alcohol dehydrogenase family)
MGGSFEERDKHNSHWIEVPWANATDLVVCAASVHMDWIEDMPMGDLKRVVYDTLTAPMMIVSSFADCHRDTPFRKHIVLVGSMAHSHVLNASSAYCASKAGLAHYVRCAAWELTPKGFTVNIVHPGNIWYTPMTQDTIEGISEYRDIPLEEAKEYWGSVQLTEKWLQPSEVAQEVIRLLEASPHLSGAQVEMGAGMR